MMKEKRQLYETNKFELSQKKEVKARDLLPVKTSRKVFAQFS